MSADHIDAPAFPVPPVFDPNGSRAWGDDGISLRAYAAIHLRRPESGIAELDKMIEDARRDECTRQAMQAIALHYISHNAPPHTLHEDALRLAMILFESGAR